MKSLLKNAREAKGLKTREVAAMLKIDQALISKFESGTRTPTKEQLIRLAELLEIDLGTIQLLWLKEKILREIDGNPYGLEALKAAVEELGGETGRPEVGAAAIEKLMADMESLKSILSAKK